MLITLINIALSFTHLNAMELVQCGRYEARGIVREIDSEFVAVINEKTQSEIVLNFSISNQTKLAPYLNKDFIGEVLLIKKFNGTAGFSDQINTLDYRIPNPINPKDTGLKLIKSEKCVK